MLVVLWWCWLLEHHLATTLQCSACATAERRKQLSSTSLRCNAMRVALQRDASRETCAGKDARRNPHLHGVEAHEARPPLVVDDAYVHTQEGHKGRKGHCAVQLYEGRQGSDGAGDHGVLEKQEAAVTQGVQEGKQVGQRRQHTLRQVRAAAATVPGLHRNCAASAGWPLLPRGGCRTRRSAQAVVLLLLPAYRQGQPCQSATGAGWLESLSAC